MCGIFYLIQHTFEDHSDQVWGVAYNEDGTRLATAGDDGNVFVYAC